MSSLPLVSIIIPVYNGERFLKYSIESALAQTYTNFELLIINDGSTDNSKLLIEKYLYNPKVHYYEQKNAGVASARNKALKHAQGKYIGFLDQDDLWLPNKLQIQVPYLEENTSLALVHSDQQYIDENNNIIEFNTDKTGEGWCFKELFIKNNISILTTLIRKSVLNQIGNFNTSLSGTDDYELWLRISYRYPIGYLNHNVACYRFHNTNVSKDVFKMTLNDLNTILSIIDKFPDIHKIVERKTVNARLFELYFDLGTWHIWKFRNFKKAKNFFISAIMVNPFSFICYRRLLWCLLSNHQRKIISWYWKKLQAIKTNA